MRTKPHAITLAAAALITTASSVSHAALIQATHEQILGWSCTLALAVAAAAASFFLASALSGAFFRSLARGAMRSSALRWALLTAGLLLLPLGQAASAGPLVQMPIEPSSFLSVAGPTPQFPGSNTASLSGYVYALDDPPIVHITFNGVDDIVVDAPLLLTSSHFVENSFPYEGWDVTLNSTIAFSVDALMLGEAPFSGGVGSLQSFEAIATVTSALTGTGRGSFDPDFTGTATSILDFVHFASLPTLLYEVDSSGRRGTASAALETDLRSPDITIDGVSPILLPFLEAGVREALLEQLVYVDWTTQVNAFVVPEPSTALLLAVGLVGLAAGRRRLRL